MLLCRKEVTAARTATAIALLAAWTGPARAVDSIEGSIAAITGDDWKISGFEFAVDLTGKELSGRIYIATLEVTAAGLSLNDVAVECGSIAITAAEFGCLSARFTVEVPGGGREAFSGEAFYARQSGAARFRLTDVPAGGGQVTLHGTATATAIDIEYSAAALQLEQLAAIAAGFEAGDPSLAVSGRADLDGALALRNGTLSRLSVNAELTDTSMSNEAGTLVTDALHALVDLDARNESGRWQFDARLSADAGEAYLEPVYTDIGASALSFVAEGTAAQDFTDIELASFSVTQGSLLDAGGDLQLRMDNGEPGVTLSGSVELWDSSIDAIYSGFLQVLLAGTVVGDLQMAGTVAGVVTLAQSRVTSLDMTLHDVSADDAQQRFAIHGLNGRIRWPGPEGDAGDSGLSRLDWQGASAFDIPFGQSRIIATLGGDDFHLAEAVRLPTMGGALVINRLRVENYGKEEASGLLDAELEPIELSQLTSAFGWPAFGGSLSGQLPLLQYDGGVVTVGGSLTARAFDGDIELANLRLEEPFGLVPRLQGDLRLRQLDLEQLTDTFSFGLIQGRLSGDVAGLEMISWRPVAMDLHLYTPPEDSSRRRISQRAVENLASVGGGGAAAALSSGFMKFFEEFSYDRIGIRCVLRDGTCAMSGAGPAGEGEYGRGYYIVKGSGLPRIDVVGYRHQVSWNALIRQLISITESGAPVVN